jgi:type IV secretory pathway ATPase VirB11/archaellum biosynthesis ATPase
MASSITSIYNDRLLASTYISELTHHLYEQKNELNSVHSIYDSQGHAKEISMLILKFENTVLTEQELLYWKTFKEHLLHYNQAITLGNAGEKDLKIALEHLKLLTQIQAKEGNVIFQDIRTNINASLLGASLEISLSIIIGVVVLALIGMSKTTMLLPRQNPSLN